MIYAIGSMVLCMLLAFAAIGMGFFQPTTQDKKTCVSLPQ